MEVKTIPVGELQANCHVVINQELSQAVLIDCGGDAVRLLHTIRDTLHLEVKAILLTHGHYDHFEGVAYVQKVTGCKVYVSEKDSYMLTSSEHSLADMLEYYTFNPVESFTTVNDGDTITEGGLEFKVLATSGHTSGSVCYICQDCLFTGDTLFRRSMGRTDFPTGNYMEMQVSLRKLYGLKGDYKVYAGHNRNTTLQEERKSNPCIHDAISDDYYSY